MVAWLMMSVGPLSAKDERTAGSGEEVRTGGFASAVEGALESMMGRS